MMDDLRWALLALWLMISFSLQVEADTKGFEADIGGYVVAGVDHYGAFYDEEGVDSATNTVLRKLRLGLELAYGKHWSFELDGDYQYDGDEQVLEFDDVWLRYDGFGWGGVQVGRMKEPFGFERTSGYSSLMTNERSLATSAFAPGRSEGVMVNRAGKKATWALGVFREDADAKSPRAVTGRVTFAPLNTEHQTIHLGLAGSWRDMRGERFQIRDHGEVYSADNVIRSPRFDADDLALLGGEFAWSRDSVTVTSEAMTQRVRQVGGDEWQFTGGYAQLGYLLTGEHRGYSRGEFDRIDPLSHLGAVELVARWSGVDLRQRDVGAEASIALLGINYYWRKSFLLRVNYLVPDISGNALMAGPDGDAVTVRAQLRF